MHSAPSALTLETEAATQRASSPTTMPTITAPAAPAEPQRAPAGDPIREALVCLESAGTRLKSGEAETADEVLSLLRAATAHLRQALGR